MKPSRLLHLTNKQRIYDYLQLTSTVEMVPEIDRAANNVSRFHGRQNIFGKKRRHIAEPEYLNEVFIRMLLYREELGPHAVDWPNF